MWPFKRRPAAPPVNAQAWRELLDQLEAMGFFRAVSVENRKDCEAEILNRGSLFDECTGRMFACDAENIAESGAAAWLNETLPALRRIGLGHLEATDVQEGPDYAILVNGVRYTILPASETPLMSRWAVAEARLMKVIDEAFAIKGSDECAYALDAGCNDSFIVILTPRMYDVIKGFARETNHELPTSTAELLAELNSRRGA